MKALGILAALLLSSCGYVWTQSVDITDVRMVKVESDQASRICSALSGSHADGCSMRMRGPDNQWRCVLLVTKGDNAMKVHEPAHCIGMDHQ